MEQPATVLILDDEPDVLWLLERILREAGYDVAPAADCSQALEQARTRPCAVAIVDANLPGASGLECARMIRARHPRIAVVLMSGYLEAAGGSDAAAFIPKPFTVRDVLEALERGLAASRQEEKVQ